MYTYVNKNKKSKPAAWRPTNFDEWIAGTKQKKMANKYSKKIDKVRKDFDVQRALEDPEQKAERMSIFKSRLAQQNPRAGRTSTILSSSEKVGMARPQGPANTLNLSEGAEDPLADAEKQAIQEEKDKLFKRVTRFAGARGRYSKTPKGIL